MQPMQILVLGSEGLGRAALEETLTRLGYVVMAADARAGGNAPSSGDVVMLDLRDDAVAEVAARGLAEGLRHDERPLMVVSERPRHGVMRALSGRPAGTMVMTGLESEAGYRVALNICAGLRQSQLDRAGFGGLTVAV